MTQRAKPNTQYVGGPETVTRLKVLLRIYQQLQQLGVGTGLIEKQVMDIVSECCQGPSGLWRLREEFERREGLRTAVIVIVTVQ